MKYIALLRGINVGGKSLVKMADLRECVSNAGFANVVTFINSGNVIFDAASPDKAHIRASIEGAVSKLLGKSVRVVVVTPLDLKAVLANIPDEWNTRDDLRCYLAFVREPVSPADVLKAVKLTEGVDSAEIGPGVLYMSTKLSGITRSGFSKLASKDIYQDITIRNFNTVQRLSKMIN